MRRTESSAGTDCVICSGAGVLGKAGLKGFPAFFPHEIFYSLFHSPFIVCNEKLFKFRNLFFRDHKKSQPLTDQIIILGKENSIWTVGLPSNK